MTADELIQLQPTLRQISGGDEDVQQTANLKLWEKRDTIRNASHYGPRVACRARWQKSQQSKIFLFSIDSVNAPQNIAAPSQSPLEILCRQEDIHRLESAIQKLPPRQKMTISHRLQMQHPLKPSAANSAGATNSANHKALRKLRQILQTNFPK